MEGSYNKVWSSRSKVKGEEFLFFYNILIDTIRYCIEHKICEETRILWLTVPIF